MTCLLSLSCFAEPLVGKVDKQEPNCKIVGNWPVTNNVTFCQEFADVGYCHCKEHFTAEHCQKMRLAGLWQILLATYGSALKACNNPHVQKDVPTELCVAQWTYYNNLTPAFKIQNRCD